MRALLRSLLAFGFVGALNTLLIFILFSALIGLGVHHLVACVACWLVGLIVSFALNKRISFSLTSRADARELATFFGCYVLQLGIGLGGFALLIDGLGVSPLWSFWIVLAVTSGCSFALMRWIVFAPPDDRRPWGRPEAAAP